MQTISDKYLKENVSIDEFTFKFDEWHIKNSDIKGYGEALFRFLQESAKPTLTEDERVILRNLKKDYITLKRGKWGNLFIAKEPDENGVRETNYLEFKDNLFQFIKER